MWWSTSWAIAGVMSSIRHDQKVIRGLHIVRLPLMSSSKPYCVQAGLKASQRTL